MSGIRLLSRQGAYEPTRVRVLRGVVEFQGTRGRAGGDVTRSGFGDALVALFLHI